MRTLARLSPSGAILLVAFCAAGAKCPPPPGHHQRDGGPADAAKDQRSDGLPGDARGDGPPDASTDAAPPDASTDAGPPDASTDAAPPDASTDAGASCTPIGMPCVQPCCPGVGCLLGICGGSASCLADGQDCDATTPVCCSGVACVYGHGKCPTLACVLEGQACDGTIRCCNELDGSRCTGGFCVTPPPPKPTISVTPAVITLHPGEVGHAHIVTGGDVPVTQVVAYNLPSTVATVTIGPLVATATGAEADVQIAVNIFSPPSVPTVAYAGTVFAYGSNGQTASASLTMNLLSTPSLFIDHDFSEDPEGGYPSPFYGNSPSDLLFPPALIARQPWEQVGSGQAPYDSTINPNLLSDKQLVILYTGQESGSQISARSLTTADEGMLRDFLDRGGKTVLLFSSRYVAGLNGAPAWEGLPVSGNELFVNYIGGQGALEAVGIDHQTVVVTAGAGLGVPDLSFTVTADTPMQDHWSVVNPAPGTDVLFTVDYDPGDGVARPVPVATGRRNVGAAGTSTIVYVGFAVEDISDPGTQDAVLTAIFDYAGVCRSGLCGAPYCLAAGAACDGSVGCCGTQSACVDGTCHFTQSCMSGGSPCTGACCFGVCGAPVVHGHGTCTF